MTKYNIVGSTVLVVAFAVGCIGVYFDDAQQALSETEDTTTEKVQVSERQVLLEQTINDFSDQYGSDIGIYVADMADNIKVGDNDSRQFISASLYKLFVAYLVLDQVDTGELELGTIVAGADVTVEYCLGIMITISDNTCGVALGNLIGWQVIDQRLQYEGYANTTLNNYDETGALISDKLTAPVDVARLLKQLYKGDLLSPQSTELFMSLLQSQELNYALPTGLDKDILFAHKTGILDTVSHDVGFITYGDQVLLVVMMTDGWSYAYDQSIALFTEFGTVLSDYVKG